MAWSGFQYRFLRDGVEIRMLGFRLRSIPKQSIVSYSIEPWAFIRGYGIRGIGKHAGLRVVQQGGAYHRLRTATFFSATAIPSGSCAIWIMVTGLADARVYGVWEGHDFSRAIETTGQEAASSR